MTRALLLLVTLVAALGAAGCGAGTGAGEDSPATVVPADAAFYVEATVRPEGGRRDDALAAAGKVLDSQDPAGQVTELVARAFASAEDELQLDYARDVEPWLGDKVAFWVAPGAHGDVPGGVALLATTDADATREAVHAAAKRAGRHFTQRSFEGVEYEVDGDAMAFAIVEEFAAFGTEPELRRTIKAAVGDSLAEADAYESGLEELPEERLASFSFDYGALMKGVMTGEQAAFMRALPLDQLGSVVGALTANGERIAVDTRSRISSNELLRKLGSLGGTESTPLLGELPGDSWGAYGVPKLGETLRALYDGFAGALGGAVIAQQLKQETGLDLEQDVFSWIGDVAFFVRGKTVDTLDGGAVIAVTDEERAKTAFGKIVSALSRRGTPGSPVRVEGAESAFAFREPGRPKPVVFARSADRVVVTYGEQAAAAALAPSSRLEDSGLFGSGRELMGDEGDPSFLVSVHDLLAVVETTGDTDADYAKAKPYLDAFTVFVGGGKVDDDRQRGRVAVGLK